MRFGLVLLPSCRILCPSPFGCAARRCVFSGHGGGFFPGAAGPQLCQLFATRRDFVCRATGPRTQTGRARRCRWCRRSGVQILLASPRGSPVLNPLSRTCAVRRLVSCLAFLTLNLFVPTSEKVALANARGEQKEALDGLPSGLRTLTSRFGLSRYCMRMKKIEGFGSG